MRLLSLAFRTVVAVAVGVLLVSAVAGCAPAATIPAAPVYVGSVVVVRSPSGGSLRGVNAPGDVAGTTSPTVDTDTDADVSVPPPTDAADVVLPRAPKTSPTKPATPAPAPASPEAR